MQPPRPPMNPLGLLVVGTSPQCGKTAACAGLAGVLNDLGFHAQAIKPFSFLPRVSIRKGYEQAYFDRVVLPTQQVDVFSAESASKVMPLEWQRLLEICRKRVYSYLLEAPGCVASPLRYERGEAMDSVDLAKALGIPMLVVTRKQPDIIGVLAPVFAYLWAKDANVAGWLAVETMPTEAPDWDAEVMYLRHTANIPYLGEIAYSPSISVEALQQGNLLRNTEMGVDMLPIQQALDLLIPF